MTCVLCRYERYGGGSGGRLPPPDSRGYYPSGGAGGGGAWPAPGGADRPAYASAWNYAGGNRDSWREPNRERDRDRDRDGGSVLWTFLNIARMGDGIDVD